MIEVNQPHSNFVGDVDPSPNLLHLMFTGLGADPDGPAAGMRRQAETLVEAYPGSTYAIVSWDQDGWGEAAAIRLCKDLANIIVRGNTHGPFTKFIFRGHSFGGCFLVYFLNWVVSQSSLMGLVADLVVLLDPVPEMTLAENGGPTAFVGRTPWTLPMDHIALAYQFLQHNGMAWWFPLGPNGTAVVDPTDSGRLLTIDVTTWPAPKIYHSDVPGDPRTWDMQLKLIQEVMK